MTLLPRATESALIERKQRWYWFSTTAGANGTGPFGPVEARTVAEAQGIAEARARNASLTVDHVVAAYHLEDDDGNA